MLPNQITEAPAGPATDLATDLATDPAAGFAAAVAAHQAGRLDEALALYRDILAASPGHADAMHLLGVIDHQRGDDLGAVTWIGKAIALKGDVYKYHYNLASALQALGRFGEALECYRTAARLVSAQPLAPAQPLASAQQAQVHMALAHLLQRLGRPDEAEPIFRSARTLVPEDGTTHAGLASALHALGRLDEAVECYRAALDLNAEDATIHFGQGTALQALGRQEEAEEHYRRAQDHRPDHAPTLVNLGTALHAQGRLEEATVCHRRAIFLHPEFTPAHVNLGAVLQAQGKLNEAVRCYRQALNLSPEDATAYFNLGTAVQAVGWLDEAVRCYRDALSFWPSYAEASNNLGQVLEARDELGAAVIAFRHACALRPDRSSFHHNLAACLYLLHRRDQVAAQTEAKAWLTAHPDQPIAIHMLRALGCDGPPPSRPAEGYVCTLFDGFAASFDHELLSIGYCGPELMATAFAKVVPVPQGDLDVLDAGCGTGLCGPVLRPWARTLTGVDLSSQMLALARRRNLYDTLITADLVEYLSGRSKAFDLIACADVLCYLGDLEPVITAAARALRQGGALAFTVEQAPDQASRFQLAPHGRYLHGEMPLRSLLESHGLTINDLLVTNLRDEDGQPSPNLVVLASRMR
ncbi:MAG: tetratricopeptide repeat protein [Rhodospirillaceae bacterium]